MRTHLLEGRKRKEWAGELRNAAHGTSQMRTRQLEGRKREERVGEFGNAAHRK